MRVSVGPLHIEYYAKVARRAGLQKVWYGMCTSPQLQTETDALSFRQTIFDRVYVTPIATGWRDVAFAGRSEPRETSEAGDDHEDDDENDEDRAGRLRS